MNGYLVVNHFLTGSKFNTLHKHLITCAENKGIHLELMTNLQLAVKKVNTDFVLFWDKDINLARRIELEHVPVFNSARAIELCDDKAKTYLELLDTVPQPKTIIAPKCFFKEDLSEFIEEAVEVLGLPLVYKQCFGSFGAQVHLCHSVEEIKALADEKPFILQEFVKDSAGQDMRIEVIGRKAVVGVKRCNKNDFRSNVTNGGEMEQFIPNREQEELAVSACKKLGLNFAGVDILMNNQVCEVNSNAHIINLMESTGIDTAPLIFDEILRNIK